MLAPMLSTTALQSKLVAVVHSSPEMLHAAREDLHRVCPSCRPIHLLCPQTALHALLLDVSNAPGVAGVSYYRVTSCLASAVDSQAPRHCSEILVTQR